MTLIRPACCSRMTKSRLTWWARAGWPEDGNRAKHRMASTNQHPTRMGTKLSVSHGACGVVLSLNMRDKWPKTMSKWQYCKAEGRRVGARGASSRCSIRGLGKPATLAVFGDSRVARHGHERSGLLLGV